MFFQKVKAGALAISTIALIEEYGYELDDSEKEHIKKHSPHFYAAGYNKYQMAFKCFFSGKIEELLSDLDTLQPSPSVSEHLVNNPGIASDILSAVHTQGSVILYDKTKKILDICNIFYTKKHFKSNLVIKEFLDLKSRFENIKQDSQSSHMNERGVEQKHWSQQGREELKESEVNTTNERGAGQKPSKTLLHDFNEIKRGKDTVKKVNLDESIKIAHEELLLKLIPKQELIETTNELYELSPSYSTNDLAFSVALNFFRRDEYKDILFKAHIPAREKLISVIKSKSINSMLALTFENSLYEIFREKAYGNENIEQDIQSDQSINPKSDATSDYEEALKAFNVHDFKTALRGFKSLAEQGNVDAQFKLGRMYKGGNGVIQDGREAAKWYRLAAEQGNAEAQGELGLLYFQGWVDLKADYVLSYMWFNILASNGDESAGRIRDNIARQMTPEQIAEAQKRTREYIEKNHTKEDAAKYKSNDSTIKVETDEDIPF